MGLHNYAAASSGHAQELAEALTAEDVTALAEDLRKLGLRAWLRWQIEFEQEIDDYVRATPAARAKKAKWREQTLRQRLILASVTHCLAAHALLRFFADNDYMLSSTGPYRDTTASAGSAYWQLMDSDVPQWPEMFAQICPSPFEPE